VRYLLVPQRAALSAYSNHKIGATPSGPGLLVCDSESVVDVQVFVAGVLSMRFIVKVWLRPALVPGPISQPPKSAAAAHVVMERDGIVSVTIHKGIGNR
jgi:hypothetical protein